MQEMGMKFKHPGIVARFYTLRYLVLKFLKIQNSLENLETWLGLMTWHQRTVVKNLADLGQLLV
jgi:hypothetical protein